MKDKVILIIDDEEDLREIMQMSLEIEGYKVFTAKNGQEGLELLHKIERPGLILLDLMMPVLDGREFMKLLESDQALSGSEVIPVILITAFNPQDFDFKINSILHKPMEMNALIDSVQSIFA